MAVIQVEVPDNIANQFSHNSIVSFDELDDKMYETVVDFGPKGISKKEFEKYSS